MEKRHKKSREKRISYKTLTEVVAMAEAVIKENSDLTLDDFLFGTTEEYDSTYATLEYDTPETDSEMKTRLDWEKRVKDSRRQQYEQLKKEFEK